MRILLVLLVALALAACQSEQPSSPTVGETSVPAQPVAERATATDAPAAEEPTADPAQWQSVEWQGLTIPIPPRHFGQELQMEDQTVNEAPVIASFTIAFSRDTATQCCELPSGFLLRIVEFAQGPEEWVRLTGEANALSVDAATLKETTVAGKPALVYNPGVTGTGILQNYVVRLDDQRLLLIDTDIAYNGYDQVIQGIRQ